MMALPVPVQHVAAPELAGQVTAFNPCTHSCCQPTNYLMIPVFQTPQPPPPYPHTIPTTSATTGITKINGETEKTQCQNKPVHDDSVNSGGGAGFSPRHVFKSKGSPRSSPRSSSSISPCSRQNLEYVSSGNMGNAVLQEPHQSGVRREYKRSRALTDKWFALQRRANEQVQRNRQIPKKTMTIPFDPRKWTPKDVHTWLFYTINMHDIEDVDFSYFVMNGQGLCILKESNFLYRVPNPGGKILFRDLRLRLWKCLKTEKAIKNSYRMHESDTGARVGSNPQGSNPGHGVQSQQERSQQPLNFSAPRSVSNPLGATNSHATSSNLPEMERRNNARHVAYSAVTKTTQSPLSIIDPHFAQRHSELDQRSVPRHYVPQTTKNHFQNLVNFSNPQSALNLTASNPREGNPIDKRYQQRFQSPLNFTLPPNTSGQNEAVNLRNIRHPISKSHQQRFPGPLDFTVSPNLSGSSGGANLSHNPLRAAQQRFQGPIDFTIPPKPTGPSRENLRHYPHQTDKRSTHQKPPQQRFQGPLNFTVPAKPTGPDQRDNFRHVPLQTDNSYQKTHQQHFQGPLNFTVPPNSSRPDQKESSRNVLHPTDKTHHYQRVQDALNFTVPSNPSAPDHREHSRLVTHPVSHPYQSPANVSRSYVTSNLTIRENLRHLEKHQFKHPAKNNSFDRHLGPVNRVYNSTDKVPTFPTPWDYNLRQMFLKSAENVSTQEENLIKSQHGSRISTLGSHPGLATERTRKSSAKKKPRKNYKRSAAEGDSPESTDLKEAKPVFQRSDSCPVSNVRKYPTCDSMDQTTVEDSTSEAYRTESDDESGQKLQEVGNVSQTTSTIIFQRSNSNPELTDPPKDRKIDVLALQRSDSHPGALSPRRVDHYDSHPGALSPRRVDHSDSHPGALSLRRVDHSDSHPGALSPRRVDHSDSHPGALSPRRVDHSDSHPGALSPTRVDQSADKNIFQHYNQKPSGNKETANLSELNSNSGSISPEPNSRKDQLIPDSNHDTSSEHIVVKTEEIPTLEHCSEIYSQNSELSSNHGHVDLPTLTPEPCHVGIPVFDPSHGQVGLPVGPGHVDLPVKVKREPDDDHNFSQGSSCPYACIEDKQSKMETEPFVCKLENEYSIAAEYKKVQNI